jgi:hypothetical protein
MQTEDLEQKKLVYLYLMNYAKTQPELVILAVNTFVKDSEDSNPLVRALAIRTMGCLRAEKIIDYLCNPLQKALRDENPYVRKTAALCVAKLYDLKPELVIDNGFLEQLREMISDSNPMVSLWPFSLMSWCSQFCIQGGCKYCCCAIRYPLCFNSIWFKRSRFRDIVRYPSKVAHRLERMFGMGQGSSAKRFIAI